MTVDIVEAANKGGRQQGPQPSGNLDPPPPPGLTGDNLTPELIMPWGRGGGRWRGTSPTPPPPNCFGGGARGGYPPRGTRRTSAPAGTESEGEGSHRDESPGALPSGGQIACGPDNNSGRWGLPRG